MLVEEVLYCLPQSQVRHDVRLGQGLPGDGVPFVLQ